MHKVRTVRHVVPSKQWNKTLHKALNVTPWDPKGKDTTDTTFALPPSLGISGRIRAPPELERKETVETEPMPEANMEAKSEGYSPSHGDDAESLKSFPPETGNCLQLNDCHIRNVLQLMNCRMMTSRNTNVRPLEHCLMSLLSLPVFLL